MPIDFQCPNCGASLHASEEYAGGAARCKTCGFKVRIPGAKVVSPPLPSCLQCGALLPYDSTVCPTCGVAKAPGKSPSKPPVPTAQVRFAANRITAAVVAVLVILAISTMALLLRNRKGPRDHKGHRSRSRAAGNRRTARSWASKAKEGQKEEILARVVVGWVALSRLRWGSVFSARGGKPLPSYRLTVPPGQVQEGQKEEIVGLEGSVTV